jgi:hypothetical protein
MTSAQPARRCFFILLIAASLLLAFVVAHRASEAAFCVGQRGGGNVGAAAWRGPNGELRAGTGAKRRCERSGQSENASESEFETGGRRASTVPRAHEPQDGSS